MGKKRGTNSRRQFMLGIVFVSAILLIFQFQNCSQGSGPMQIGGGGSGPGVNCYNNPSDPSCGGGITSPTPTPTVAGGPAITPGVCPNLSAGYQGLIFPAAYKVAGLKAAASTTPALFNTQVQITNPNSMPLNIQASFWTSLNQNGTPTNVCITMDAGQSYTWPDFIGAIAGNTLTNVGTGLSGLVTLSINQGANLPTAQFVVYDSGYANTTMGPPVSAVNITKFGQTTQSIGPLTNGNNDPTATRSRFSIYSGCPGDANYTISAYSGGSSSTITTTATPLPSGTPRPVTRLVTRMSIASPILLENSTAGKIRSHELVSFSPQNIGYPSICWGTNPTGCFSHTFPQPNLTFTVSSPCSKMFTFGTNTRNSDNMVTTIMPQ